MSYRGMGYYCLKVSSLALRMSLSLLDMHDTTPDAAGGVWEECHNISVSYLTLIFKILGQVLCG